MRFSKLVMPGITMIAVTHGLARFSFGLLLPDIVETLDMSDFVSGIISSLFYASYCLTIVVSTVITAREGPRGVILAAGTAAFSGLILMGISPNIWIMMLGVLLAGGSTGLISPPYGAAISLWITTSQQGKANTWINSGTSLGIVLSGAAAILLTPHWRLIYYIFAGLTLLVLIWNYKVVPKSDKNSVTFQKGSLSIRGTQGALPLITASVVMGISTAAFWTFSRSFIEVAHTYSDWQLSGFWIMIGLFGVLGGLSGSLVEKAGLSLAYKVGSSSVALSSILLAVYPDALIGSYLAAALFGVSYIFLTGVLLVWGIRVFIDNSSLGIGIPFLLLAVGQVLGTAFAGLLIGTWGYAMTFMLYGLIGMAAAFLKPGRKKALT